MWLATTTGFYSITKAPKGDFQIRARKKKHLVGLLKLCDDILEEDGTKYPKIIERKNADYRFRIFVRYTILDRIIGRLTTQITYGNFKNAAHGDPEYDRFLNKIWLAGMDMQDGSWAQYVNGSLPKKKDRRDWVAPRGVTPTPWDS